MLLLCAYIYFFFFFFRQKTAYEMRISDWSSDVCSSDLSRPSRLWCPESALKGVAKCLHDRDVRVPLIERNRKRAQPADLRVDRKSAVYGKSVSVRVAIGGRRIIKKNISIDYINMALPTIL